VPCAHFALIGPLSQAAFDAQFRFASKDCGGVSKNLDNSPFVRLEFPAHCTHTSLPGGTMTIGQSMLPEFDQEMENTRNTLERVPEGKWNWKPHDKSGTVGWLVSHIANIPDWAIMTLKTENFDYAPANGSTYQPPKIDNRKELLTTFDKGVTATRAALAAASDQDMIKNWSLLAGGNTIFTLPRVAVLRGMIMNHLIHHRAQLTVYYRLLGIPVPALYGPSADEGQPGSVEAAAAN
jgi:uncharacterized damage-inducible protein DinB